MLKKIKVNMAQEYAIDKYDEILNNHFKVSQTSNFYDALFSPIIQILRSVVIDIILLVSGYNKNIFGMKIGMIISAITLLTDMFIPIDNIGTEIKTIQKSIASVKRINLFFKMEIQNKKEEVKLSNYQIEYKNVMRIILLKISH